MLASTGPGHAMGFGQGPGLALAPNFQQAFSAAQTQFALRRQFQTPTRTAGDAGAGDYANAQVVTAIAGLARAPEGLSTSALLEAAEISDQVQQSLIARGLGRRSVPVEQEEMLEVVVNLLRSLTQDPRVAGVAKDHLRRVQGTVHAAALSDQTFFTAPEHPVRVLLNQIASIRPTGGEAGALDDAQLTQLLEDLAQAQYAENAPQLHAVQAMLETMIAQQSSAFDTRVDEVVQLSTEQQRALRERRDKAGHLAVEPSARPALSPEWARWIKRARALRVGENFLMNANTDKPYPAWLIWIGEDFNPLVFVDEQGHKALTLTLEQTAMYLRRGVLKTLRDNATPPVERALLGAVSQIHEQIAQQASHDVSTGLLNRSAFLVAVAQQQLAASGRPAGAVLCQIALDNLRSINDEHGLAVGDDVLQQIIALLSEQMADKPVILGRLSGDELGIYWEKGGLDDAYSEVQTLFKVITSVVPVAGGEALLTGCHAGLTEIQDAPGRPEQMLQAVAEACAAARNTPDNPLFVAGAELKYRQQLEKISSYVEKAIKHERLMLLYQDVRAVQGPANPAAHLVVSAEDRNGKLVPPMLFSQAAATSPLAWEVDLWMLRHALQSISTKLESLERFSAVILPLSRAALEKEDLANTIIEVLMQTAVPPARLCFAIADCDAVANLPEAIELINTLRGFGCQFLLDEFGATQTDYAYVRELAVDYVAIQQAILATARQSSKDFAVAKSLNELVHFMGKLTLAKQSSGAAIDALAGDLGIDFILDQTRATRLGAL